MQASYYSKADESNTSRKPSSGLMTQPPLSSHTTPGTIRANWRYLHAAGNCTYTHHTNIQYIYTHSWDACAKLLLSWCVPGLARTPVLDCLNKAGLCCSITFGVELLYRRGLNAKAPSYHTSRQLTTQSIKPPTFHSTP